MISLRILVDAAWPKQHRDCAWFLCDGNRIIESGYGDPSHWSLPESGGGTSAGGKHSKKNKSAGKSASVNKLAPCDVIFTKGQVSCLKTQLPKGPAGRRADVIGGALENQLFDAPGESLFYVQSQQDDGLANIAVISKERLTTVKTFLASHHIELKSAWGDGMLLPSVKGQRCGYLNDDELLLPTIDGGFISVAMQGANPQFTWLLKVVNELPKTLSIVHDTNEHIPFREWGRAIGIDIDGARQPAEQFPLDIPEDKVGFLLGDKPKSVANIDLKNRFSLLKKLLLFFAVLFFMLQMGEWLWLKYRVNALNNQIEAVFKNAFPNVAVVDPVTQMQQQVDTVRRSNGRLGKSDFLSLLNFYHQVSTESSNQNMSYEGVQLRIKLSAPTASLATMQARLQSSGIKTEFINRQDNGPTTVATLVLIAKED